MERMAEMNTRALVGFAVFKDKPDLRKGDRAQIADPHAIAPVSNNAASNHLRLFLKIGFCSLVKHNFQNVRFTIGGLRDQAGIIHELLKRAVKKPPHFEAFEKKSVSADKYFNQRLGTKQVVLKNDDFPLGLTLSQKLN